MGPTPRVHRHQLRGPYALWHRTHTFEPLPQARTLCRDEVRYRPRGGPLAGAINRLLVERDVAAIFRYRAQKLAEIFPPRTTSTE